MNRIAELDKVAEKRAQDTLTATYGKSYQRAEAKRRIAA
jgi:hypothetical protein